MDNSYKVAAAAGTIAVAEEILLAVKQVFADIMVGKPYSFDSKIEAADADLFLCFTGRITELAKMIPREKILGIDMLPSPKFCVTMAKLQSEEIRWVFCNNRTSAKVIVDHCSQNGLPVDRFDYATYGDTPEALLIEILRQAKHIVGVSPLVSPGRILSERYGKYLRPDCEIFAVDRILTTTSLAAVNRWLISRREDCLLQLEQEMGERQQLQERLEYENTHDTLTDFYNRRFFETASKQADEEHSFPLAVMVIDVDGLKNINDSFGHAAGDAALREAALIIKESFGSEHLIARVGGDEFFALLNGTSEEEVKSIVTKMRELVGKRARMKNDFPLNLSLGYARSEENYIPVSQLLKAADEAMYKNKVAHIRMKELDRH